MARAATALIGRFCSVLILSMCAMSTAEAQAAAYVGGSIGQSSVDIECDLDITCSADEKDTGWKFYGGYQFTPNFAVEFGYVDLGETGASGNDSVLGTTSVTIEASGFSAAALGAIPLGDRFALFGKVGLFRWDVDARASSSVFGSGSLSESGIDFLFGAGAAMSLGRSLSLRVEWERFSDVGDNATTGEADVDFLSAGIVLRF